jgi:hypothetical protein
MLTWVFFPIHAPFVDWQTLSRIVDTLKLAYQQPEAIDEDKGTTNHHAATHDAYSNISFSAHELQGTWGLSMCLWVAMGRHIDTIGNDLWVIMHRSNG